MLIPLYNRNDSLLECCLIGAANCRWSWRRESNFGFQFQKWMCLKN